MNQNHYAVIGHPIAHTMSPFIHARLFALAGRPADCGVFDISPSELTNQMLQLRALNGFNITIPHKQGIIPFLDELSDKAAFFSSVNTVKNDNGRLIGYTTDGTGFCSALKAAGAGLNGRTVVLGAGGAGRVMAFEAALSGGSVTVAVRPHGISAAEKLCADIQSKVKNAHADFCLLDEIDGEIDLLANATPVGMYPNTAAAPVSQDVVRKSACVFDAVYNPNETALLKMARKSGMKAVGGMSMLVWQAAAAHEIWYGAKFNPDDISTLCTDAVIEMKKTFGNIVLCGCMGSGKTTVGRLLSKNTGRAFVDMDVYIEQNEGMTVQQIFAARGEAAFRRLEQDAAKALSQKSGLIIATGGGALVNPENTAMLKETGVVVLLDAEISVLKERLKWDHSRPLLAKPNRDEVMEALYCARSGIYRAAADVVIPSSGSANSVAEEVRKALKIPLIQK